MRLRCLSNLRRCRDLWNYVGLLLAMLLLACHGATPAQAGTRGSDELFWAPTIEQALDMAQATGRPIFMVYYTCVGKEGEQTETYAGRRTVW